ncbi:hypothetical protein Achl_4208 (plasmid) [Pseudarthrobacter chlorophenolicus A6]|uniref:Integral membrane protein n=1 Tax=Pseudarthrobacter chlorophenolicus (strain ATCC 700700 / DSM 12829 / CIP 107037 / JCM 12360 / KCTC 9906 / NCIMB 13794 / A6) TaxID=452863 RepID=B8HIB2_PSECP|nr:hypothetical protein [Pseudarthrobacter chlorophenolicus]ACL42159.1 hypothetical protein Achl_4208 [Pseudarthrobacter chlorophenolicus A6]SDQ14216.1 hypothetical protein SAMN04489738_0266 [Pseudarthrobacter chlorophenolicus]
MAAVLYLLGVARIHVVLNNKHDRVFNAAALAGTGALLTNPHVYVFIDGLIGGQNWARWAMHTLMALGLWQLRCAITEAVSQGSGRRDRFGAAPMYLTVGLQTALFVMIQGRAPTTTNFVDTFNAQAAGAGFYSMVIVYIAWVCAEIATACYRFVPKMRGVFRVGFSMVFVGSALGIAAAAVMLCDSLSHVVPVLATMNFHTTPLYVVIQLIPIVFCGIGLTLPVLAGRVQKARNVRWEAETHAVIAALRTRVLSKVGSERTLGTTTSTTTKDSLHRMIVEIWDAELASPDGHALTAEERTYLLDVERRLNPATANGTP